MPNDIDTSNPMTSTGSAEYYTALSISQAIYNRYGKLNGFSGHTTT